MLAARKRLSLHADILSGLRTSRFVLFITEVVIKEIRLMEFFEHREIKSFSGLRFCVRGFWFALWDSSLALRMTKRLLIVIGNVVKDLSWVVIDKNVEIISVFLIIADILSGRRTFRFVLLEMVTCELLFVTGS